MHFLTYIKYVYLTNNVWTLIISLTKKNRLYELLKIMHFLTYIKYVYLTYVY